MCGARPAPRDTFLSPGRARVIFHTSQQAGSLQWFPSIPFFNFTTYLTLKYRDNQDTILPGQEISCLNRNSRDFPGGPVVKVLCLLCRGCRFNPWSGSQHPTWLATWSKKISIEIATVFMPKIIAPSLLMTHVHHSNLTKTSGNTVFSQYTYLSLMA